MRTPFGAGPAVFSESVLRPPVRALTRHALPTALAAGLVAQSPEARAAGSWALDPLLSHPGLYALAAAASFVGMCLWLLASGRRTRVLIVLWLAYLLGIGSLEEWLFRIALPCLLAPIFGVATATLVVNAGFALLHRLTLGWRLADCVAPFVLGLVLSITLARTGDFGLIVALHWLASFFWLAHPGPVDRFHGLLVRFGRGARVGSL